MRFVTVTWLDAWAEGVDDATVDNVHEKHKPVEMETRGWLLKDDDVGVSIFYERCLSPLSYRGRTFIPRGMIVKVEDFPTIKPKRVRRLKGYKYVGDPDVTPA